jgi:hypothetical protein
MCPKKLHAHEGPLSQPAIKWGQAERYFNRHGYTITGRGGDKVIQAPRTGDGARSRDQVTVGHTSCSKSGSHILPCYISQFKRVFGVTAELILAE